MVRLLARVIGVGIETADMLVHEVLSRNLRDRKAVARYAGLTGSPSESGTKRRERGLAKTGNARVRRGMLQLAWRFLRFQEASGLAQWYRTRTVDARGGTRKTMIVALARKLLIALWRLVTTGEASGTASSCVRRHEPCQQESRQEFFGAVHLSMTAAMTIRGGGNPTPN
jgi:transposase